MSHSAASFDVLQTGASASGPAVLRAASLLTLLLISP